MGTRVPSDQLHRRDAGRLHLVPTFSWYDFESSDYRWFYNMLLVASNAGEHTAADVPIVPFVHWHTTAPPSRPDPGVKQLSERIYQDLLWHMLLRGHDTFFLWCLREETADEVRLVHEVYAAALEYREFLDDGTPVTFHVPETESPVVSGLRLGDRVLVRRTDFTDHPTAGPTSGGRTDCPGPTHRKPMPGPDHRVTSRTRSSNSAAN